MLVRGVLRRIGPGCVSCDTVSHTDGEERTYPRMSKADVNQIKSRRIIR